MISSTVMLPEIKKLGRAIFIMGNHRSDKTAVAQMLTQNLNSLQASYTEKGVMTIFDKQSHNTDSMAPRQNLVPDLMLDSENKIAFWNCPAFDDTTDPEADIAAKYFLHIALNFTSRAKFIFTVSHSAVKLGSDGKEFNFLVTNFINLFTNLSRWEDSIGLLVVKGEIYGKEAHYQSDEQIVSQIHKSLKAYLNNQKKLLKNEERQEHRSDFKRKIQLFEGILGSKRQIKSAKLHILQFPQTCGPLDKMSSVRKSKDKITELYQKKFVYSSVTTEDFQITFTNESYLKLNKSIIPIALENLEALVAGIANDIRSKFQSTLNDMKAENFDNIQKFFEKTKSTLLKIQSILNKYNSNFRQTYLSTQVEILYQGIGLNMIKCSTISTFYQLEKQVNFFVKSLKSNDILFQVSAILGKIFLEIDHLVEFYEYCSKTKGELVDHFKQNILSHFTEQTANDAKLFKFISENNVTSLPPSKLVSWNMIKLEDKKYLAKLIREVLPENQLKCVTSSANSEKKHLVLTGTNVKLSDVLNKARWPDSCKGENVVSEVSLLALERVYIDTDIYPRASEKEIRDSKVSEWFPGIEKIQQLQLSIISPIWIVIGSRKIILDGFHAEPEKKSSAFLGESSLSNIKSQKVENLKTDPIVVSDGKHGNPGKAGNDGGNAGNFFGIYATIENGHLLEISANGGDGEDGKDGLDGNPGKDGENANWKDFTLITSLSICAPYQQGLRFGYRGANPWDDPEYDFQCNIDKLRARGIFYTKLGEIGNPGGNGGQGGKGGSAGHAGTIKLITFKNNKIHQRTENVGDIITTQINGLCGKPGLSGQGKPAGKNGNSYTCLRVVGGWEHSSCKSYSDHTYRKGQDGTSETGKQCSNLTKVNTFQPWRVITEYKTHFFARQSHFFEKFVDELNSNAEISLLSTPSSFAIEVVNIEEKLYELASRILPDREKRVYHQFYETFLDRLKNYTKESVKLKSFTREEKVALTLVYSTVFSKLVAMRRSDYQLNAIKTEDYFDSIMLQLTELKAAQRQKTIADESNKYKSKLDDKVDEADKFITTTVTPAIENAKSELEDANKKLVEEINEYLNAAKEDLERKKKLKKQLEAAWLSNTILGIFSFFGSIFSMFGPEGKVAGAVIDAGVGVSQSVIGELQVTDDDYKTVELPKGFKSSMNGANDQYFQNQIALLDDQTSFVSELAGKGKGTFLQGVKTMAENTKQDIESLRDSIDAKNGELDIQDISILNDLENSLAVITETIETYGEQVVNTIEKIEAESDEVQDESEKADQNEKSDDGRDEVEKESGQDEKSSSVAPATEKDNEDISIAKGLAVTMKLAKAGGTLIKAVTSGKKGVERMEQSIKDAEQQVKAIEMKKAQFYNDVIPLLNSANKQLTTVTSGLPGESVVALSVKKWKMKGVLKNMRGFIIQFSQQMKVSEVFHRCFDSLDEAVLLLIQMYDHIERHEEKKELADFIAHISSASDLSEIADGELKGVLTNLDYFINANLFLEDYQKGIHAFKQWAFPFANRYLHGTKHEKLSRNLTTLINSYTSQVKDLNLALKKYAATTEEGDQYSMISFFTSDAVSSEPFYKWSNENWRGAIKKLLAGEPIHLKADVDMVGQNSASFFKTKSAIKYKSLALVLKTRDKSRQIELERTLDHFHMDMRHSGISLYKVMDKHYVMYDKSVTYHYSFEKTKYNNYVTVNGVKYKVDGPGSDYLMSPYTWWTFQISDAKAGGLRFSDLGQFENEVDLELEGNGVYLEETRVTPQLLKDLQLADYYEAYDATTTWAFKDKAIRDRCIVIRKNLKEDNDEIEMTSYSASDTETGEWNAVDILAIVCPIFGIVLVGIGWYACKKYFSGYIAVPL